MIRSVAVTGSTNDDVLAAAANGAPEGLWIRADQQTAGRGRQGRPWVSPTGNLYASGLVRLRPCDPPAPTLGFVAGLALHQAISAHASAEALRLKWPNDLFAHGAKLAGILLERAGDAVAVGVGVNLTHHPPGLDQPATDLRLLTGRQFAPEDMAEALVGHFSHWLACWRQGGLAALLPAWEARTYSPGTPLRVRQGSQMLEGRFARLAADGALLLRLPDGDLRAIHAGDVFPI